MEVNGLAIPDKLVDLIDTGRWPKTGDEARWQNGNPLISEERIRRIFPTESQIYLYPPPFVTVEQLRNWGEEFWDWQKSAPLEISFSHSVPIGDFGLGSDAPIMLDYRNSLTSPSVIYLCWSAGGTSNHWKQVAADFVTFAGMLGL